MALNDGDADIVAGTTWLFARPTFPATLDYLVVDEAGQMALANVLAIAGVTQNFILLGDPNQLSQPTHGIHPPGVNLSVLDNVIQDKATMPVQYGLFLETTYRLHPSVCSFISEAFYDGKLEPDESTKRQALATSNGSGGMGLRYLPVEHAGNRQSSPEEDKRIRAEIDQLVGGTYTNCEGRSRPLRYEDIMVVAPYNAQVFELQERLPGARIGTVDKFQGQEAPIVIYSMTTSTQADAPHGMEFLYSLNRLNVATSRARCICVLVASPDVFEPDCRTPRQIQLANAFCRYRELACEDRRAGPPGRVLPGPGPRGARPGPRRR